MRGISAYILDPADRAELAEEFPPLFAKFIGHHVTYEFGASDKDPLPPAGKYQIIGYAVLAEETTDDGIEALVVAIDGDTRRPDGGTYHITWSHGPGYSPKDSNDIVKIGY